MQSYTKNLAELTENAYICKLDEYQNRYDTKASHTTV